MAVASTGQKPEAKIITLIIELTFEKLENFLFF